MVNVRVGNEEWTVNRAVMEAKQWKSEDLWDNLVIADLAENLQGTTIGCKRKAPIDLWSEKQKFRQIDHLIRSGRVYQSPNFQTGESSNSSTPLTKELSPTSPHQPKSPLMFSLPKPKTLSIPLLHQSNNCLVLKTPPEGMIKQQLERT